jgi:hypothetical protein
MFLSVPNSHSHRLFGTAWQFSKEGLKARRNKSLAQTNKSQEGVKTTNKRSALASVGERTPSLSPTNANGHLIEAQTAPVCRKEASDG